LLSRWEDVIGLLAKGHTGAAKVAVYPNSDVQYCRAA
jgi:hypothetical protein